MTVRFLKEWRGHVDGWVGDIGGGVAIELIRRGIAEKVEDAAPQQPPKRGRGRPRKVTA